MAPEKIVVGCDGSPCANAALAVAAKFALDTGDELVLVFAAEPPGRVGEEFTAYREALEERGREILREAERVAREAGVETVTTRIVGERPSEALNDVAEELDARMLVVGSYGESPLRSAILGSVPHKLLQISPTPVLCVRG